jgi:hypothetical protein
MTHVTPRMRILVAVEPADSRKGIDGLGEAITYMLKYWDRLTLFVHQPGVPLDNDVCERTLKKAILHRKNAYFYEMENGARVGELFMSLIHTCERNVINPFDYLTQLLKHAEELAAHPADWMPWNYRDTLAQQVVPQPIWSTRPSRRTCPRPFAGPKRLSSPCRTNHT